jgi:hypothetical protein
MKVPEHRGLKGNIEGFGIVLPYKGYMRELGGRKLNSGEKAVKYLVAIALD